MSSALWWSRFAFGFALCIGTLGVIFFSVYLLHRWPVAVLGVFALVTTCWIAALYASQKI